MKAKPISRAGSGSARRGARTRGRAPDRVVEMNEALVLGALRQNELTATARSLNKRLRSEITKSKRMALILSATRAQLARHAAGLERRVIHRTAELVATNRRLEAAMQTSQQDREKIQALLADSQHMQEKLRQMTRQMISAQEEERKKISRELHDDVVQTLVGLSVELSNLGHAALTDRPDLRVKIARTRRLVQNSIKTVHSFARQLRPSMLDDLGLIAALHSYSKSLAERKRLKIHLVASAEVEILANDRRTALYRVAQEALTNVSRHAQATKVTINLTVITGAVRMEISDNGQSFPVDKIFGTKSPKRLGLLGMRERVEMVGGRLAIESKRGQGTTVRAEVPFVPETNKL